MSFITKKKRYKFQVDLSLVELSSVTFVSGNLFAKVRLQDGGSFTETTTREEVYNHCVKWGAQFIFACKMNANATTGVLESCLCRISVRKEVKGGRTFQKLGFADVNLAEYAGAGLVTRKYLLEGYDTKRRQDNSTLKISVVMTLMSGDPLFKVPSGQKLPLSGETLLDELTLDNKGQGDSEEEADATRDEDASEGASSGFGSLTRYKKSSPEPASHQQGHSRSDSFTSTGYVSNASHSRQSSATATELGHTRNPSNGSSRSDSNKRRRVEMDRTNKERIDATRVDADDLVNELVEGLHIEDCDTAEESGLQLYIAKDGTAAVGGQQIKNSLAAGSFKHVVFDSEGR